MDEFPANTQPTLKQLFRSLDAWDMFPSTRETEAYDLDRRVREEGESILHFARALGRLGERAFEADQTELRSRAVRKRFIDGWTDNYPFMRRMRSAGRDKPMRDLIRIAVEIEAEAACSKRVLQSRKQVEVAESLGVLLKGVKNTKEAAKTTKVVPLQALAAIGEDEEDPSGEVAARYGQDDRGNARAAPVKQYEKSNTYSQPKANVKPKTSYSKPVGQTPSGITICWICGGQGHTSRYCRTPKAQGLPWKSAEKQQPKSEDEAERTRKAKFWQRERRRERGDPVENSDAVIAVAAATGNTARAGNA
jgi:hypothetical protein